MKPTNKNTTITLTEVERRQAVVEVLAKVGLEKRKEDHWSGCGYPVEESNAKCGGTVYSHIKAAIHNQAVDEINRQKAEIVKKKEER